METSSTQGESQPDDLVHLIFREHHEVLLLNARRKCSQFNFDKSTAQDFVQELYMKVFLRQDQVRAGMEKGGIFYLLTMLDRLFIDASRKNKGWERVNGLFETEAPQIADVTNLATSIYHEQFLEQMQRWLSAKAYEVMRIYMKGYTYKEVAEQLELTETNVSVIIYRSRKVIAEQLKRLDSEFSH